MVLRLGMMSRRYLGARLRLARKVGDLRQLGRLIPTWHELLRPPLVETVDSFLLICAEIEIA
jgi:hypothetical protein